MLTTEEKKAIRDAYREGQLRVKTVSPATAEVSDRVVTDVMRHNTLHKQMVRLETASGRTATFTVDHSVFTMKDGLPVVVEAGNLAVGDSIVVVEAGTAQSEVLVACESIPNRVFTYDLSVPGPQNFVLSNGILAHNSYSIGGISLSIEKSSKYESIKQNAEGRFDKMMEQKSRTVKIMRGLQQSRYGLGVRSSFGPSTGKSVLTPRNFIGI